MTTLEQAADAYIAAVVAALTAAGLTVLDSEASTGPTEGMVEGNIVLAHGVWLSWHEVHGWSWDHYDLDDGDGQPWWICIVASARLGIAPPPGLVVAFARRCGHHVPPAEQVKGDRNPLLGRPVYRAVGDAVDELAAQLLTAGGEQ
jgi:hypothetical protein